METTEQFTARMRFLLAQAASAGVGKLVLSREDLATLLNEDFRPTPAARLAQAREELQLLNAKQKADNQLLMEAMESGNGSTELEIWERHDQQSREEECLLLEIDHLEEAEQLASGAILPDGSEPRKSPDLERLSRLAEDDPARCADLDFAVDDDLASVVLAHWISNRFSPCSRRLFFSLLDTINIDTALLQATWNEALTDALTECVRSGLVASDPETPVEEGSETKTED